MNEKKLSKIAGLLLACVLTGCVTNKGNDTDVIEGNSRVLGRFEATVEGLDRAAASSRERIGNIIEASRGIEDGVERLEYLFGSYEREVEFLQSEIDRIRAEAEDAG